MATIKDANQNPINPDDVEAIIVFDTTGTQYRIIYLKEVEKKPNVEKAMEYFMDLIPCKGIPEIRSDSAYALVKTAQPGLWEIFQNVGTSIKSVFGSKLKKEGY